MIEAIGLSKFYRDFAAIRDVTFSIPQGQVVAFLGPNGAGKSTTMKRSEERRVGKECRL